ncbi:uncharacterized protein LOC144123643 [Amblyomma americanum]
MEHVSRICFYAVTYACMLTLLEGAKFDECGQKPGVLGDLCNASTVQRLPRQSAQEEKEVCRCDGALLPEWLPFHCEELSGTCRHVFRKSGGNNELNSALHQRRLPRE